jgi:nucleotide-sensitive chloride channel 1A
MPFVLVTEAPKTEDFTPLSEHQSQTPVTFFGSRPVLHHHAPDAKLAVRKSEYEQHDVLRQIHTSFDTDSEDVTLDVDVWITSR